MTARVARESHSGHRHNDEEKSCTRSRFSYFYDIIGRRGGRSHGENIYGRGTGEVQQGGADAHAPGHAGPVGKNPGADGCQGGHSRKRPGTSAAMVREPSGQMS